MQKVRNQIARDLANDEGIAPLDDKYALLSEEAIEDVLRAQSDRARLEILADKLRFIMTCAAQVLNEVMNMEPSMVAVAKPIAGDLAGRDLKMRERTISRSVGDDERNKLAHDHVHLCERERWLESQLDELKLKLVEEMARLKAKYEELKTDAERELAEVSAERERIYHGIRYGVIEEPQPVIDIEREERASALTSMGLVDSRGLSKAPAPDVNQSGQQLQPQYVR